MIEHCASEIVKIAFFFSRETIILNKVLVFKGLFDIDNMRCTKSKCSEIQCRGPFEANFDIELHIYLISLQTLECVSYEHHNHMYHSFFFIYL